MSTHTKWCTHPHPQEAASAVEALHRISGAGALAALLIHNCAWHGRVSHPQPEAAQRHEPPLSLTLYVLAAPRGLDHSVESASVICIGRIWPRHVTYCHFPLEHPFTDSSLFTIEVEKGLALARVNEATIRQIHLIASILNWSANKPDHERRRSIDPDQSPN